MANPKYTLLIEADLDKEESLAKLQESLKGISTSLSVEISKVTLGEGVGVSLRDQIQKAIGTVQVGVTAGEVKTGAGTGGATTGGGGTTPSVSKQTTKKVANYIGANEAYESFLHRVNELESSNVEITKQHANYVYDAAGNFERLNSGVLEYKNEFGEVRKESYGWVEAQKEGEKSGEKNYEWMKKTGDITDNIASRQQNYTKLLADAQKAMHDSASKTVHKSAGIQQVKDVQVANGKLKTSIDEVSAAIGRGQRPTKEQIDGLKNATLASKNAGRALSDLGKDANSWSHEMSVAIKRSIEWAAAMTLLYGSLRQIQQGIEFIKELNKEMVAIQTVTGATTEQVNAMKFAFNDLARETGATTQQVAQGSTEWFRQGKTMEETAELIRSTMVLSKLGNMEAAQATEYLTSMLNGFKLEAEDSMGVLDKIIYLDNTLATSSAEVAEALSRSSNSAQQMGVSLDELSSYVAVVSSVSRRSAINILAHYAITHKA